MPDQLSAEAHRAPARRRRLSRRRVRDLVAINQCWLHRETETVWSVRQIHRVDGVVELARHGERRMVTLLELGVDYGLVVDGEAA